MIYIVGLGPGHKDYMLKKAIDTLNYSNKIIGFERAINSIDFIDSNKQIVYTLKETLDFINNSADNEIISVVASGDPCFFGISSYLSKNSNKNIEVIAGISSFQYLTSKLNKSWSSAYTSSMHGREDMFLDKVKENNLSIWLCDNKNSPNFLCNVLYKNNINCNVIIGENLSYEDEIIVFGKPEKFLNNNFSGLSVFIVELNL